MDTYQFDCVNAFKLLSELTKYYQLMKCDNCTHYHWYWDYCDKWKCKVDARAIYDCFEPRKNNEVE